MASSIGRGVDGNAPVESLSADHDPSSPASPASRPAGCRRGFRRATFADRRGVRRASIEAVVDLPLSRLPPPRRAAIEEQFDLRSRRAPGLRSATSGCSAARPDSPPPGRRRRSLRADALPSETARGEDRTAPPAWAPAAAATPCRRRSPRLRPRRENAPPPPRRRACRDRTPSRGARRAAEANGARSCGVLASVR